MNTQAANIQIQDFLLINKPNEFGFAAQLGAQKHELPQPYVASCAAAEGMATKQLGVPAAWLQKYTLRHPLDGPLRVSFYRTTHSNAVL